MNYLLHCHKTPGHVVPIPQGVKELMTDMSREVLRCQPDNILEFIADYLEQMLLTRENYLVAQATVDDVMNHALDVATFYRTTTMPESKAKHVVGVFRKYFKESCAVGAECVEEFDEKKLICKLVKECGLTRAETDKALKIIRNAHKKYFYQKPQQELRLGDGIGWKDKVKNTLLIYSRANPTQADMNRAATCLQAAYRGHYMRKKRYEAAIKIQAAFRGHKTRKSLQENIETNSNKELTGEEEAAKLIQSLYRGHATRKRLSVDPSIKNKSLGFFDENEAAKFIQSTFRSHKTRESMAKETRWERLSKRVSVSLSSSSSNSNISSSSLKMIEKRFSTINDTKKTAVTICGSRKTQPKLTAKKAAVSKSSDLNLTDAMQISTINLGPRVSTGFLGKKSSHASMHSRKSTSTI